MSYGSVKLSKIHLKQQSAWGTKLTSFVDADLMEVTGEFVPPAMTERLQPDVNKADFTESPITAGAKAPFDVSFSFVMHGVSATTPSGNPSARNEHLLFKDVLGTGQAGGFSTVGVGSTDSNLVTTDAAATLIGQAILAPITGGRRFVWPKSADPGVDMATFDALAAAIAGQAYGSYVAALAPVGEGLPFTMQFAGVHSNTGWRCWDGRVASLSAEFVSRQQIAVSVTMRFLNWEPVDGLAAAAFAFPVPTIPPIKGVISYDANAEFCPASATLSLTQELGQVDCFGAAEGIGQLVASNRTAELTVRTSVTDAYANNWREPGDVDEAYICVQLGTTPGAAMAVFIPSSVVNAQETLQVINNLWGSEVVYRAYPYSGDTDTASSVLDNTGFRVAFA